MWNLKTDLICCLFEYKTLSLHRFLALMRGVMGKLESKISNFE
jgi:hypothetical protein